MDKKCIWQGNKSTIMAKVKTYLFENMHLASSQTIEFVKSIDHEYVEIDTETGEYRRERDFYTMQLLINPSIENIVSCSDFLNIMGHKAEYSFHRRDGENRYLQIEHFAWLIRIALRIREENRSKHLTIHLNYFGTDFLQDLKDEVFGENTKTHLMLILRQQTNVTFKIYSEYKLVKTLTKEEDLEL